MSYRNVILMLLSIHLSFGVFLHCDVVCIVIALSHLQARLLRKFLIMYHYQ